MAEAIDQDMVENAEMAGRVLCDYLKARTNIPPERVDQFGKVFAYELYYRFTCPPKDRALRGFGNNPVDESLLEACEVTGIGCAELNLPPELSLCVDAGDVTCRRDGNSEAFQVGDEYRSGKSSPDMTTSDYHSCGSPPACVSEDEPQHCTPKEISERPPRSMVPREEKMWWSSSSQAPGSWIPSPVYVPCDRNMVIYAQPHQPGVLYFLNLPWRPSTSRRLKNTRRPNPDLIKRLTGRVGRK